MKWGLTKGQRLLTARKITRVFAGLASLISVSACGHREVEPPSIATDSALTRALQGTWLTDCGEADFEDEDASAAVLFDETDRPLAVSRRIAISGERLTLFRTFHSNRECTGRMITVEEKGRFLLPKTSVHTPRTIRVTWERRFFILFANLPLDWSAARICRKRDWIPGDRVDVTGMSCGDILGYAVGSTWEYAFNAVTGALYVDGQTYFRQ